MIAAAFDFVVEANHDDDGVVAMKARLSDASKQLRASISESIAAEHRLEKADCQCAGAS